MGFFDFFRRKKDDTKDSARESAKERLDTLVGGGRRFIYRIDEFENKEDLDKKTEEIKLKIQQEASELFKTDMDKVKIVVEEHNGYVIIITNINFE
jgi:septum formation topological specificity factor MinE